MRGRQEEQGKKNSIGSPNRIDCVTQLADPLDMVQQQLVKKPNDHFHTPTQKDSQSGCINELFIVPMGAH